MKDPLGVSPSKENQGTTRGKEKIILTSVGIEPTASGLDLPLLCQLSYEVGQRKVGDDLGGEERNHKKPLFRLYNTHPRVLRVNLHICHLSFRLAK